MKKLMIILAVVASCMFTSCEKETWSEGDPAYEHVYYIGFEDWGNFKNNVAFSVKQGETIAVPVQFHSERIRNYDVVTFFYVSGTAVLGTDYQIVDENGSSMTPDSNGAFSLNWPKAVKGVKKIYIKALNGNTGTFTLQTFDPNAAEAISYTNTLNNSTNDYEVHSFTQNYKVTVTIE